jgi:hypothetical protein
MEWQDLLKDGYLRIYEFMKHTLIGLSQDDLDWQPKDGCNSIGWLAWHLSRQQDAQISSLMGEDQLWTIDKWYIKFNRLSRSKDIGFGHIEKQLKDFKSPDIGILLDYQKVVSERSIDYFSTLSKTDLDRKLDEPWFKPLPIVGVRIISILDDSLLHAGQMAYIRGLRHGMGWQKY